MLSPLEAAESPHKALATPFRHIFTECFKTSPALQWSKSDEDVQKRPPLCHSQPT